MRIDPAEILVRYLRSLEELKHVFIGGDMVGRKIGQPAIIVDHAGGERVVRHRMDRFDFTLNFFGKSKSEAAGLAYVAREYLLERFPDQVVSNYYVADVREVDSPVTLPDYGSDESRFVHQIQFFIFEVDNG
ncbi:hypothetical protein [Streptomyces sp. WZ-12]|uniref:hypothetical protein n=1 Tax=Streptomyces sp. WZ-12 TaxID=3030210 RepID=UPI0023814C08|nr:hypothetical protein [Streptomyces sp. WZ-12]